MGLVQEVGGLLDEATKQDFPNPGAMRSIKPNMTELTHKNGTILFSYQTPVAAKLHDGSYIHTNKKWSSTTSRHISTWTAGQNSKAVDQSEIDKLLK